MTTLSACLLTVLWKWERWSPIQWLCASLYKPEGQGPILTEEADPLQVFEACEIDQNEFRFIPFVLWLKKQPSCPIGLNGDVSATRPWPDIPALSSFDPLPSTLNHGPINKPINKHCGKIPNGVFT